MTEKKTFKNPLMVMHYEHGELVKRSISHSEGLGNPYGSFPVDEWDMEVTFTKKVKPLAVGDVARFDSWDRVYSVTILAIDDDTYWVRTDSGDYHTLGADDLDR